MDEQNTILHYSKNYRTLMNIDDMGPAWIYVKF